MTSLSIRTILILVAILNQAGAAQFYVAPGGNDAHAGTAEKPFATLGRAQQAARALAGKEPVTVTLRAGIYYLPETLVFTSADSGTATAPVVYQAAPGAEAVVSGGLRLDLPWQPWTNGIWKATLEKSPLRLPPDAVMDQLFVNGERQPQARYPNFDPSVRIFNGHAKDAINPERIARWQSPRGGYLHAMHSAMWGGMHYRITGKDAQGKLTYEGGWQNNRPSGMHKDYRFVENIFEELDAPGEWFHDAKSGMLYYCPARTLRRELKDIRPDGTGIVEMVEGRVDLARAIVEIVRLRHLVEFRGRQAQPVKFLTLRGLTFRHAARTFMDTREPLLRSDWTIYRGGAVLFSGAEDCGLADCVFDQVGGNAVFVNNYNRRLTVRGCHIVKAGGNGVAFVGDPAAARNGITWKEQNEYAAIDKTPGPKTDNYPADCLVEDCLIHETGRVEKQTAPIQIAMARNITVRHCSLYDVPRAGINIGDGCWGGHVIEFCDIFDTVKETGDHGSFNSWGRDRFWGLKGVPGGELPRLALLDVIQPVILRHNRWRCDHGWDVDLDDGSSHYEIYNNLMLRGGLKLREGFHRRVWNNITVNNSLHPHVWYENSGDVVTNNLFMGAYRPAAMSGSLTKWGREVDRNLFTTSEADRRKFADKGCDPNSVVGDPLFVDPARGDFRVKDGSPALKLGFRNFPTDQFGVQKPELKALAQVPQMPELRPPATPSLAPATAAPPPSPVFHYWLEARVRDLEGEEYSAFGVSKESGGIHLADVPPGSAAARAGFQTDDLIQSVNESAVKNLADLWRRQNEAAGAPLTVGLVRKQQSLKLRLEAYPYHLTEAADDSQFMTLSLAPASVVVALRQITAKPATHNEPLACLNDGTLAAHYGPVFGNNTMAGMYKADLSGVRRVARVNTWSFNQNGNRGAQRFFLFGSAAETDPGWDVQERGKFVPVVEVDTCNLERKKFQATSIRATKDQALGSFRWLVWVVYPVSALQENTAFQEFQVQALP